MRKFCVFVFSLFFLAISPAGAAEAPELYNALLTAHVSAGRVDYPALCHDARLGQYLDRLAETAPDDIPTRSGQMAFWINAYNAYTLKLICDNYPVKSINDLHNGGLILGTLLGRTAWDRRIVKVKGQVLSLGEVEHKILRPVYKDPRIHFAIVCAAKGCPPLRSEAYEGDRLEGQLNDQAKIFLAQPSKNSFDLKTKTAAISPIFSWFSRDFGSRTDRVLSFLTRYLNQDIADSINADPLSWRVRYTKYDWSLNGQ